MLRECICSFYDVIWTVWAISGFGPRTLSDGLWGSTLRGASIPLCLVASECKHCGIILQPSRNMFSVGLAIMRACEDFLSTEFLELIPLLFSGVWKIWNFILFWNLQKWDFWPPKAAKIPPCFRSIWNKGELIQGIQLINKSEQANKNKQNE